MSNIPVLKKPARLDNDLCELFSTSSPNFSIFEHPLQHGPVAVCSASSKMAIIPATRLKHRGLCSEAQRTKLPNRSNVETQSIEVHREKFVNDS